MKYGFYDDKAKEYVIETPYTPLPWINYLGNNDFFSLISNTAGGYSFYKDAKLLRLTRFRYNNVPNDAGGRCYYIKEDNTVFSPSFLPAKTPLDTYRCRHGLGYTIFESSKNNIFTQLKCFVPLNSPCEINQLKIINTSDKVKKIIVYSAIEWCLWNAVDDACNFQRNLNIGEVEVENSTIFHKTEYRERRNHYAFFSVNSKINGFDSDRFKFLGHFNGWDTPEQVTNSTSGNTIASGWSPIASHRIELEIEPNQEKSLIFILGYAENSIDEKFIHPNIINKTKAYRIMATFDSDKKVDNAFSDLTAYWNELLSNLYIDTPIDKLNRSVNIWNQYQCMITFNMSRSASYFESGMGRGMGFRDSCQDLLGFVHLIPERCRERIIDIASIQFDDGSTYHQYQPLTKRGNADIGSGFNDDPLWLIACVSAYIKETGDNSILDNPTPFNNVEGSEKPLFEHLRRSINYIINNKGPHGLPLIGRADWNDCLNLNCFSKVPGESFQICSNYESGKAESVFIAGMFVKYGKEYAELCKRFGERNEADVILSEVKIMQETILEHGWDGEWFLRAYDAFEKKVGSKDNNEGKIFVEPQGFCVMAGIGGKEYGQKALNSVDNYLVNDFGIEILNPSYKEYHIELGEISSYPQGYKENGSVFCHNNPWIILAHVVLENNDSAFELFKRICPSFLEDISDIRKTEPYVYSQTIAGRQAPNYGLAKNSWLTGTASWALVAISQGILGIQADYEGLRISPCLPKEISEFTAKRKFRGINYVLNIICDNQNYISVNGNKIIGNVIPVQVNDCEVQIHV